jgi:hypothetical protein
LEYEPVLQQSFDFGQVPDCSQYPNMSLQLRSQAPQYQSSQISGDRQATGRIHASWTSNIPHANGQTFDLPVSVTPSPSFGISPKSSSTASTCSTESFSSQVTESSKQVTNRTSSAAQLDLPKVCRWSGCKESFYMVTELKLVMTSSSCNGDILT